MPVMNPSKRKDDTIQDLAGGLEIYGTFADLQQKADEKKAKDEAKAKADAQRNGTLTPEQGLEVQTFPTVGSTNDAFQRRLQSIYGPANSYV